MKNKDYYHQQFALGYCCPTLGNVSSFVPQTLAFRNISAQVLDEFGEPAVGVLIWPDQNFTNSTVTDQNGNFTLENVPVGSLVNFSYMTIVTQITENKIGAKVNIGTIQDLAPVEIVATKPTNTLKYIGYGFLALVVLLGITKMGSPKTVKATI